jgi:hypothetical protein
MWWWARWSSLPLVVATTTAIVAPWLETPLPRRRLRAVWWGHLHGAAKRLIQRQRMEGQGTIVLASLALSFLLFVLFFAFDSLAGFHLLMRRFPFWRRAAVAHDQLRSQLNDVVELLEKAAYERGWADAIKHVMVAAQQSAHAVPEHDHHEPEPTAMQPRASKAGYGSVGAALELAIEAFGERGVAPMDVVEHARRELGEEIKEISVRGRLSRLTKQGKFRKRRGRWFRIQPMTKAVAGTETGGAVTPPDHELDDAQGDFHAAA